MKINTGVGTYKRPWMYDKQEDAIFNEARYSVTEGSVQCGKTKGCVVWLFEKALQGDHSKNYWWVAPVEPQAEKAFRDMKTAVPRKMIKSKIESAGKQRIEFLNGATVWFKSADNPDSLYGESVYAAVIDEASRVKEESWHSVRSRLAATGGPMRIIGNVKGRNNWFYNLARKAEGGEDWECEKCERRFLSNMHYSKITVLDAIDAGVLPESELEEAKDMYPERVFRELYLAEPGDDGGNPFGIEHINACTFTDNRGNKTAKMPKTDPVVWGWDIAKAQNFTVGIGLDRDGGVCRFKRWQFVPWDQTIKQIIEYTGNLPALVDSSSAGGDQVLERLQDEAGGNFRGYKFTGPSKQDLMLGLAVAIQNREVGYPAGPITKELKAFEYEHTRNHVLYRAPDGFHDDCVDALALAWRKKKKSNLVGGDVKPALLSRSSPWKS